MLIIRGDQFDVVVRHARWLAFFGDWAYSTALNFNTGLNILRRKFGFSYWSLSAWAKLRVKNAVNFIGKFEEALAREARESAIDGVICGHIHCAAMHSDFGIAYYNCGDWVESCTALVEHHDGRFELIRWTHTAIDTRIKAASPRAEAETAKHAGPWTGLPGPESQIRRCRQA